MTTATENGAATDQKERRRRGRPAGSGEEQKTRFFAGEINGEGVKLTREFKSEPEAQLESLRRDQPYFEVQAWKATPDLSNGVIAVTKRPYTKP